MVALTTTVDLNVTDEVLLIYCYRYTMGTDPMGCKFQCFHTYLRKEHSKNTINWLPFVAHPKQPCYHTCMNTLCRLLAEVGINDPFCPSDIIISSLCYNSKDCKPNSMFFAFEGIHTKGSLYIEEALDNGAVCILSSTLPEHQREGIRYYQCNHPRSMFAHLCAAFYDYPAKELKILGVTGTDGKSTTCDYLYQILSSQQIKTGLLGTVSMDDGIGKRLSPYRQSTPEADQLHAFLRRCVDNGLTHVVLECTSHALSKAYDRLATIEYDLALVTTVTSEHQEFHGSISSYVDAKCNLVRSLKQGGIFVSTLKNPHLSTFLSCLREDCASIILENEFSYAVRVQNHGEIAIDTENELYPTDLLLPCLVSNALLAILSIVKMTGIERTRLLPILSSFSPVQGRMISLKNSLGYRIIIDFAHTADAYEKLFSFMHETKQKGCIIAVFGCAGERDTSKRAPMGKIASSYADHIILTEEDPRQEGNTSIFKDLRSQMDEKSCMVEEIEDRREALIRAFSLAQKGDTLLFLGKGHETFIDGKEEKRPWNEEAEIRTILEVEEKKPLC